MDLSSNLLTGDFTSTGIITNALQLHTLILRCADSYCIYAETLCCAEHALLAHRVLPQQQRPQRKLAKHNLQSQPAVVSARNFDGFLFNLGNLYSLCRWDFCSDLSVDRNQFSGSIPACLPSGLLELTTLDLHGNSFTNALPANFTPLVSLQWVPFNSCWTSIPDCLFVVL